jgi:hypothetical protein
MFELNTAACTIRKKTVLSFNQRPDMPYIWINTGNYFDLNEHDRAGAIIHELTHYLLDTDDHKYGRIKCKRLRRIKPSQALENADNYALFAQDFMKTKKPFHPKFDAPETGWTVEKVGYENRQNKFSNLLYSKVSKYVEK